MFKKKNAVIQHLGERVDNLTFELYLLTKKIDGLEAKIKSVIIGEYRDEYGWFLFDQSQILDIRFGHIKIQNVDNLDGRWYTSQELIIYADIDPLKAVVAQIKAEREKDNRK